MRIFPPSLDYDDGRQIAIDAFPQRAQVGIFSLYRFSKFPCPYKISEDIPDVSGALQGFFNTCANVQTGLQKSPTSYIHGRRNPPIPLQVLPMFSTPHQSLHLPMAPKGQI